MKAHLIYTYNPNISEESQKIKNIQNLDSWLSVIYDLDQKLRQKVKYEGHEHLQEARDLLHEIICENGLNIDDLY